MADKPHKLIHAAKITLPNYVQNSLFLRQLANNQFQWMEEKEKKEHSTPIFASTAEEAIRLARIHWKYDNFRPYLCGWRYTLPERDEHGNNALFYQMIASYSSLTGVYFDEEVGHNCFVNFASQEALDLWKRLKIEGRV